jgi:hypothetical protein
MVRVMGFEAFRPVRVGLAITALTWGPHRVAVRITLDLCRCRALVRGFGPALVAKGALTDGWAAAFIAACVRLRAPHLPRLPRSAGGNIPMYVQVAATAAHDAMLTG